MKGWVAMKNNTLLNQIEKFRFGDMESFLNIHNEFKGLIEFYSFKTGEEDTIQELTVFLLELLYDIDIKKFNYDLSDDLHRYIAVCLRNKYIDLSKKEQKYRNVIKDLCKKDCFYAEVGFDSVFIKDLIKLLPLKQAVVIVYRYIYGYSDTEIADLLGVKRQAVFNMRKRALENLKSYM